MDRRLFTLLAATALLACDDSPSSSGATDTSTTTDTTTATDTAANPDTNVSADTAEPDTNVAADTSEPNPSCTVSGFAGTSNFSQGADYSALTVQTQTNEPYDSLSIELYAFDDYHGATAPGTFDLTGSTYQDCSNCVVVRAQCSGGACAKKYLVDEGTLVITQWDRTGGSFKAKLVGAKAHEVTIDTDTFVSTLVPNGGTWCLDGVEFEAPIAALPVSDRTQPACVAEGTGRLLHDNIANFTLTNCNGKRVKLHETCDNGTTKALWLIGTTGWCSACHEFLKNYVAQHGGPMLTRQKVGEETPGLDMLIVLGENAQGAKPTSAYCKAYAADLGIDPEMVVMDWSDTPVQLPLINAPEYAVETNSLGTTWHNIDPYLFDENGSVTTSYPWWALLRTKNMEYYWSDRAALQSFELAILTLLGEQ